MSSNPQERGRGTLLGRVRSLTVIPIVLVVILASAPLANAFLYASALPPQTPQQEDQGRRNGWIAPVVIIGTVIIGLVWPVLFPPAPPPAPMGP